MHNLTIASIFSNFDFYQQNYLNILNQPELYYTLVDEAWIDVQPFKQQTLYLGDLLQLWLSTKWKIEKSQQLLSSSDVLEHRSALFIFQLQGELFLGKNTALAWSVEKQKVVQIQLKSIWASYVVAQTRQHPQSKPNVLSQVAS